MAARISIVRAESDEDLARWVEVRNRVDVRSPATVSETRFFMSFERGRVNLLATLDGRPAGAAFAGPLVDAPPGAAHGELQIRVDPELRRRGVGSALFDAGAAHLRSLGKREAQGTVSEDAADGLAFAGHRGFVEVSREMTVGLELARFEPSGREPPPGIELTDFATRPDLLRGMWELDVAVSPDIPGPDDEPPVIDFDRYRQLLSKPEIDGRLIVLALAGDEVVGIAMLIPRGARPEHGQHWLTGVRRDHRGKGLARLLKERQLATARTLGMTYVRTSNEARNAPMRHVNRQLGYQPEPAQLVLRGPLPGT